MEATRKICAFVHGFDIGSASDVLRRRATDLVVDYVGVTIAAADQEVVHVAKALAPEDDGRGRYALLGNGRTSSAGFAAFFNGALAHALEYDDSTLNPVGHPSCVILPALFALAEHTRAGGSAVLEAYMAGLEVHSRLGQAEVAGWSASGAWLPIGHVSLMGAAAACAKLLRLAPERIADALGFAAHFSGALAVSNGSLAKPLGSGEAARAGLESALLARAGGTAAPQIIERAQGFADVYLGAGHDLAGKLAKLGAPHHLEEIGIAVKRYPSCYATHWGVDALLLMVAEHGLTPHNVASVTLDHPTAGAFCDNPTPRTSEEARFSHEYNLAVALLDGVPGPQSYAETRIVSPDVQALLRKVRTADHPPELPAPAAWEYRVTVATTDGRSHSLAVPRPLGHPRHPMSRADLEAKFRTCAVPKLGVAGSAALLQDLRAFESLPDLDGLGEILSAPIRAAA